MGYSAVKGGDDAIRAAERLVQMPRNDLPRSTSEQIQHQLGLAVDKVMSEGGVYAPDLAAQAIAQTEGDLFEASFVLRAYRSTLPRFGSSLPVGGDEMRVVRRISAAFKDIPGGQLLGRTRDYTLRLLDVGIGSRGSGAGGQGSGINGSGVNGSDRSDLPHSHTPTLPHSVQPSAFPKVADILRAMGLVEPAPQPDPAVEPVDITRTALRFPATRPAWLQALARGESGAMVCLAYSSLRGYGGRGDHGTVAELRVGDLPVRVVHPVTGQPVTIGWTRVTEVEMTGAERDHGPKGSNYGLSYGLVFGHHERKAIAMAILDSTLQAAAPIEGDPAPANDQEMVLSHIDGIESFGFVEHLKLPHYVTFGSSLATYQAAPPTASSNGNASGRSAEEEEMLVRVGRQHHHGDGVLHDDHDHDE